MIGVVRLLPITNIWKKHKGNFKTGAGIYKTGQWKKYRQVYKGKIELSNIGLMKDIYDYQENFKNV